MKNKLIQKLIDTSRKNEDLFQRFFDRDNYDVSPDQWFMDESLLSLYWLPIYDTLTLKQKQDLSKLETSQIIYCYSQSETIMCNFMARHLLSLPFASDEFVFLLREQVEEYRHQDMFVRALELLWNTYIPITWFLARQAKISSMILPAKRFFLLQIIVELISDDFWKMCYNSPHVNKLVQDVSEFHHIEEARHIVFAEQYIDKKLKNLTYFWRTFGGIIMALNISFMNTWYIREDFYKQIGLTDTKKLYKAAIWQYKLNAKKNFTSPEWRRIISKYRLITWLNKYFIKKVTWIDLDQQ